MKIENLINNFYEHWDGFSSKISIPYISPLLNQLVLASTIFIILLLLVIITHSLLLGRLILITERAKFTIRIKDLVLVSPAQFSSFATKFARLLKTVTICFIAYLYIAIIFSCFQGSRNVTTILLQSLFRALEIAFDGIIAFIPNLIFIILIVFVAHHLLRMTGLTASAVSTGRITFPNFHKEWALPTEKIIKFLTIVLALILITPYLPGFDTPAFKGITIFLGVILSLGSTAAVANVVAGFVLIYMRAFKVGDRIQIGEIEGDIEENSILITRIRSIKNRIITIPNSLILASPIANLSALAKEPGIVVYTTVTIGYDVAWAKVHELLLKSAAETRLVESDPEPYILQKKLDDNSVVYELNVVTKAVTKHQFVLSELHQSIQDLFRKENIEIISPKYTAIRDGNDLAIPKSPNSKSVLPRAFRILNSD